MRFILLAVLVTATLLAVGIALIVSGGAGIQHARARRRIVRRS